MQGPPALTLSLPPCALWRAVVAVLAALAAAALGAWVMRAAGMLPMSLWGWLLAAALGAIAAAWTLHRLRAVQLRWDGGQWHLAEQGLEPRPGTLDVALDTGGWLLLSFRPEGSGIPWRRRWIPVGRRGAGPHWHALRCAVYSPRPAPGGSSEAASPTSSE